MTDKTPTCEQCGTDLEEVKEGFREYLEEENAP